MLIRLGSECRDARVGRGLSIDEAAAAAGISRSAACRIELGQSPMVPFLVLARYAAVVGLDLSARAFPGPRPVRDAAQLRLLNVLRHELHPSLRWDTEVPLPIPGDQRAWDARIAGRGWAVGVEAETAPHDVQALTRRLQLKLRDGDLDLVLLLVRDTRRTRALLREAAADLDPLFPIPGRRALAALRSGRRPEGNAIVVLTLPPKQPHSATRRATAGRAAASTV